MWRHGQWAKGVALLPTMFPAALALIGSQMGPFTTPEGVGVDTSTVGFVPKVWSFFGGDEDFWGRPWVDGQQREESQRELERLQRGMTGAR